MAEHRFQTPGPIELEVKIPSGDVDVETVEDGESVVVLEGNERMIELTDVSFDGRRLSVELRGKKPFGITIAIGDFSFGSGSLRVRARIPNGSDVTAATAAADVKLRGTVRTLEVRTASGDVGVRGDVDDDATIKTVSGDAKLERVGGDLEVQTVSGDVGARFVGGSVRAKSVSGDLRVEAVHGTEATAQSVSGDIEIGVARGRALDVDAGSVSGDLSSEVPLGSDPAEGGGDVPPLVVRGKTVSGDFRVIRAS